MRGVCLGRVRCLYIKVYCSSPRGGVPWPPGAHQLLLHAAHEGARDGPQGGTELQAGSGKELVARLSCGYSSLSGLYSGTKHGLNSAVVSISIMPHCFTFYYH